MKIRAKIKLTWNTVQIWRYRNKIKNILIEITIILKSILNQNRNAIKINYNKNGNKHDNKIQVKIKIKNGDCKTIKEMRIHMKIKGYDNNRNNIK